jgi:uncharacterized protein (DUF433 family)
VIQAPLVEPVPLRQEEDGTLRIGKTRVALDIVVRTFQDGATPEEIVQDFSSLKLSDVYSVIAYYLRHQDEVERYLREREAQAHEIRHQIEARWPTRDLRRRLLARQRKQ